MTQGRRVRDVTDIDFKAAEIPPWELVCLQCGTKHDLPEQAKQCCTVSDGTCQQCKHNEKLTVMSGFCMLDYTRKQKGHSCSYFEKVS